jgi:hypothetical protein
MKKFMIMAVLATVLSAIPVFAEGSATATSGGREFASATALAPLSGQVRIRVGERRRNRRRVFIRHRNRVRFRRHVIRYRRRHR